ncbi:MAG TPA: IS21 family transposase [Acidimicrobiales bacterium]
MITVEDWAEIRRLHRAQKMGVRAIARHLGIARNTVREALRSDGPPRYERRSKGSIVDEVDEEVRALLADVPTMPATVIAERIGWSRSMTVLRDRVGELRPLFLPPDPAQRTFYRPGELAQFDLWQPDVAIPVGHGQATKLWVVVGALGFSRFSGGWMVPSRAAHDVLGGHLEVLRQFGALPRKVVWDQEGCIGRRRGGETTLTAEFAAFIGTLGIGAVILNAADPEAKGIVERNNGYYETSFLPGRSFADVADFNAQFTTWLRRANHRVHATTKVRPSEAVYEDRGSMLAFPPVDPDVAHRFAARVPRDHYLRFETNDYSINPRFVGRRVEVRAGLESVLVTCESTVVAEHRRCLARNQVILHPDHARTLRLMRTESAASNVFAAAMAEVEERDLAIYDRAVGAE